MPELVTVASETLDHFVSRSKTVVLPFFLFFVSHGSAYKTPVAGENAFKPADDFHGSLVSVAALPKGTGHALLCSVAVCDQDA